MNSLPLLRSTSVLHRFVQPCNSFPLRFVCRCFLTGEVPGKFKFCGRKNFRPTWFVSTARQLAVQLLRLYCKIQMFSNFKTSLLLTLRVRRVRMCEQLLGVRFSVYACLCACIHSPHCTFKFSCLLSRGGTVWFDSALERRIQTSIVTHCSCRIDMCVQFQCTLIDDNPVILNGKITSLENILIFLRLPMIKYQRYH